jgi:hypothetical protein
MALRLTSPAFKHGSEIPEIHAYGGFFSEDQRARPRWKRNKRLCCECAEVRLEESVWP